MEIESTSLAMSKLNERARRWCFTINNYEEEHIVKLREFGEQFCKYMIFGKEKAETGTLHLQGYFHLTQLMYRATINKTINPDELFGRQFFSYLVVAKGNTLDNYKYCSKEGDFEEIGTLPAYLLKKNEQENNTKQIMSDWLNLSQEDFEAKWPYQAIHWRRKLMEWEASRSTKVETWGGDLAAKNYWICGPPGTGKSRWVRNQVTSDQCYCKLNNKWWGGYDKRCHRVVLMEDFPSDGKYLAQHMKIWADRYSFTGETKGGQIQINPGTFFFIVTSNFMIEEIFDGVDMTAIKRRFTEVQIASKNDVQLIKSLPFDSLMI